jgi:PEP-CTERM motif
MAIPSFASPVTGQANISGTVTVTATSINFGTFTPEAPNTGDFVGLTGGTLKTLTGPPLTGPTSLVDFGVFNVSAGTVHFNLTNIAPGFGTNANCLSGAIGAACTPSGSPFTLTQVTSDAVDINLTLSGLAYLNTFGGDSGSGAIFTTQNIDGALGGTVAGILAQVAGGGFTSSYSATFTATPPTPAVPEPASLLLMGVGLLGAGAVARKKIRG